ncbi:MAG: hypothetical protein ACK55Z_26405, partial [bacterium]
MLNRELQSRLKILATFKYQSQHIEKGGKASQDTPSQLLHLIREPDPWNDKSKANENSSADENRSDQQFKSRHHSDNGQPA